MRIRPFGWLFAAALVACSPQQKQGALEKGLAEQGRRTELFSATLRVLDENPEYGDELFAMLPNHPRALDRQLGNAAASMDDPQFTRRVATHLAAHPQELRAGLGTLMQELTRDPEARAALLAGVRDNRNTLAQLIASDPKTLQAMAQALAEVGAENAQVAEALREALQGIGGSGARE